MSKSLLSQIHDLEDRFSRQQSRLEQELRRVPAATTVYYKHDNGLLVGCSTRPRPGYTGEELSLAQVTREHRTTIRGLRCSLTRLSQRLDETRAQHQKEDPLAYPPDFSKFDIRDVTIHNTESWKWVAYWDRRPIGGVVLNIFGEPELSATQRCIFKAFVDEGIRQHGVGRLLYDVASAYLTRRGLELAPSPTRILSDEAFEFWKRYRPEAVRNDARHWRSQYLAKHVLSDDVDWELISIVGSRTKMGFIGRNSENRTKYFSGPAVFAQIGEPVDIWNDHAPQHDHTSLA